MLVGAARVLSARRSELSGEILFMFQPGEEGWHGARYMLEEGLLEPLPDVAYALHVLPNSPFGLFTGKEGPMLASADTFEIFVRGRGGHASMPHDAVDPVVPASEIVIALQSSITRRIPVSDPAVLTVSQFHAGSADNVIAPFARLSGTVRTLSEATRETVLSNLQIVSRGVTESHGAVSEVNVTRGFPVTHCDIHAFEQGRGAIINALGGDAW